MKNICQLFFLIIPMIMIGQTKCDNANSYLVNAYSHVKDAYDSNNISHLKYYANRSFESFTLSKTSLDSCNCEPALELTEKGMDLLAKVEYAETFEDGRFYVKRARDIAKESVIEIDKCSLAAYSETSSNISDFENQQLSELEKEQQALKQQQQALKLKEQKIKTKLAEQKQKELILKKQQLILSYRGVISSNIETYNQALTLCNCTHSIINPINTAEDVSTKSINDINNYFTNNLKELASNYLLELNNCK